MTLRRLSDIQISAEQFCVCAQETQDTCFVKHVGLAGERQCNITYGSSVKWVHVSPPFKPADSNEVHAVGWLDLSDEERATIRHFIKRHVEEVERIRPQAQYIIFPCKVVRSEDRPYCRFSCAGFVLEAYRTIGITILDKDAIPEQDLDFLCKHYSISETDAKRYAH